jgi:glutaredoxin
MRLGTLGWAGAVLAAAALGTLGGRAVSQWAPWREPEVSIVAADHSALLREMQSDWVLFSLSTCRYCADARAWLGSHDVAFVELVVDTTPDAQRRFESLGEPALPVFVGAAGHVRGFVPDAYVALLMRHRAGTRSSPAYASD